MPVSNHGVLNMDFYSREVKADQNMCQVQSIKDLHCWLAKYILEVLKKTTTWDP